jgi:DNA-directed RNA polymerase specialized sigma subunit
MEALKTGSNDFYQWIRAVYHAIHEMDSLNEKKDFYETKFYSCRTMHYEPFRGSNYQTKDVKTYWLIKIDEVELKINQNQKLIKEFNQFNKTLNEAERIVIEIILRGHKSMITLAKEMKVSRNRVYEIKISIIRKFKNF